MNRFRAIVFTPSVKAAQVRMGSRAANARTEAGPQSRDTIGDDEREFLAARDSFYLATVGERGWPYIQDRGGPKGIVAPGASGTQRGRAHPGRAVSRSIAGRRPGAGRQTTLLTDVEAGHLLGGPCTTPTSALTWSDALFELETAQDRVDCEHAIEAVDERLRLASSR